MKHFLLALILTASCAGLFAQSNKKNYSLKLYSNFQQHPIEEVVTFQDEFNRVRRERQYGQTGLFSPAILFQRSEKRFMEIELSRFGSKKEFDKTVWDDLVLGRSTTQEGAEIKTFSTAVRIEGGWNLTPNSKSRFKPLIGASAQPSFTRVKTEPLVSQSFDSEEISVGLLGSIVPRLLYEMNERLFLDLNIPITAFDISQKSTHVANPNFTARQQRSSTFDFQLFPKVFGVRLGVGLKV